MSQKLPPEGLALIFADGAAPNPAATSADDRRPIAFKSEAPFVRLTDARRTALKHLSHTMLGTVRTALREADWLTHDRVTAFTRIFLVLLIGCIAISPWAIPGMEIGRDFAAFWTAARLALEGRAADAYGEPGRAAIAALFGQKNYAPFFYPPTALLFWLPFAFVPFVTAAILWIISTGAAYAAAIRALLKGESIVPTLAFPAVWVCALFGQNSLFSTALFGGSAVALDRYPLLAGALIGCLTYKPQIAILAPLALIVTRRWRALAAAIATTLMLVMAATVLFGVDAWLGFIRALPEASAWNLGGAPGFEKFASVYAAIRLLGGPGGLAWLVQLTAAAIAIAILIVTLRMRPGGAAEIAILVAVTGLCVPSLGNYEMTILAVPGAWLVAQALTQGWLPYERAAIAALFLVPFAMVPASANGVPLGPIAVAALIILVARRIRHFPRS